MWWHDVKTLGQMEISHQTKPNSSQYKSLF